MNKFYALLVALEMKKLQHKSKGQGVIEYAGALVVAAVMVAAVLAIGPDGIKTLFTSMMSSIQTYLTGQLPK